MAAQTVATASSSATPSPYQLDIEQTLKASQALLDHCRSEAKRLREQSSKRDLLTPHDSDSDGGASMGNDQPIWLTLATKKHIVDKHRLTPNKVKAPHSLTQSTNLSICLITADPQRSVKNIVAEPTFPASLSSRISRIIGFTKLKARYATFESRRQLLSEHDIFLADDRIVTRLPETLGKVFYKGTAKRPIPITISHKERVDGKVVGSKVKKNGSKDREPAAFASPAVVAKEIETTLSSVPVYLKPGANVAVRVGLASFTNQQLAENIAVVAQSVIDKHVVKGWRNVKSIHIKSPDSVAIPIWLTDDMWVGDEDVVEDVPGDDSKEEIEDSKRQNKRKRNPISKTGPQAGERKKVRTSEVAAAADLEEDRAATAARKAKLAQQKSKAFKEGLPIARAATKA